MSRIYKLLRKTDEERINAGSVSGKDKRENMDIDEIKKRILEKINKEKSGPSGKEKAALSILSEKLGVATAGSQATGVTVSAQTPPEALPEPDSHPENEKALKEYSEKLALAESENKNLKKLHEDALKENENLALQLKEKEKAVSNVDTLIARVYSTGKEAKERASRVSQLEEMLKAKEKKLAEIDKIYKKLENTNDENEDKIKSYDKQIKELQEKAARSDLEVEEKAGKIDEAEATCRELNASLKESARALRAAENSRDEIVLKLESASENKKELEEKLLELTDELESRTKKIAELEELNEEAGESAKKASTMLRTIENDKKDLEEKISLLNTHIETAAKKLDDEKAFAKEKVSKLREELEMAKRIIKEKEADEIGLREALSEAVSGLDSRDKKIEADMRYYEKLLREMNDLKKQVRMIGSKRNNPGI